jgi:hypothetical protein
MKKFLHAVSEFMLSLLGLVAGGFLVYVAGYNQPIYDALLEFAKSDSHYVIMAGGVALVLGCIYLVTFGSSKSGSSFVSFDTTDGEVSISRAAIGDFVRKLGNEFAAVVSLNPLVFADRRQQLTLTLNLTVRAGTRVPELSKLLQERVKESLRDDLGFCEVKKVSVKVQKIVGNPIAPVTADYEA